MTTVEGVPVEASAAENIRVGEAAQREGLIGGLVSYLLWGFLPLLFYALQSAGSLTIVADRTIASLIVVAVLIAVTRRWGEVRTAFRDGRALAIMFFGALMLAANWLIYVWAVDTGQVLEATFGYFINPIVNVALGMVLLGERQNRWQIVAIGIACIAVVIQWIGIGRVPYIALGLAVTFALYGYFRKTAKASSTTGLFVETLLLAPFALLYVGYTFIATGPGPHADPLMLLGLAMTGPATAVPLLLFAFAVQRLRLTTIGMLQYIAPSIGFMLAIFVFHEPLNSVRLFSFALIWLSLVVYTSDGVIRRSNARVRHA